jgi:transcriptional regulator with XRE-family HTH domain
VIPSPNDELRNERLRRGWSRPDLAEALQRWEIEHGEGRELPVDRNFIYRWETGKRGVSEFYAARLEALLGIPRDHFVDRRSRYGRASNGVGEGEPDLDRRNFVRTLAGVTGATVLPGEARRRRPALSAPTLRGSDASAVVMAIRRALLGFGPDGRLPGPGADPDQAIVSLQHRVRTAWELRQRTRYVELGDLLPDLVADAEVAVRELSPPHRRSAVRLLVHTFNTTASVLKRLGDTELASIAADRAVRTAQSSNDALLLASAYYRLANVFLPAGRLVETREIALSAARLIEPELASSPAWLATWGGLLLTAAVASARQGDWVDAWELFGEAELAGERLGRDHADLHTIFGPTNVAIHGVQLSVELGDGRAALHRANRVNPDRLPTGLLERRCQFLIDLARGRAQRRHDTAAIATLLEAEQVGPEEVHLNPLVHDLVVMLLHRERRGAVPELRGLADRMGMSA